MHLHEFISTYILIGLMVVTSVSESTNTHKHGIPSELSEPVVEQIRYE